MLDRYTVRQKLGLLLIIPVGAMIMVAVPFAEQEIDAARAAEAAAQQAQAARDVGSLLQDLQQERLAALAYLGVPNSDRASLAARISASTRTEDRLRATVRTGPAISAASDRLNRLNSIRQQVLAQDADTSAVYTAYHQADVALIDALQLNTAPAADAMGIRQLETLDALMRATEEASSAGAALVAYAGDPKIGSSLLDQALIAQRQFTDRFRQMAGPADAAQLTTIDTDPAGERLRSMMDAVDAGTGTPQIAVADALAASIAYNDLRRLAQDRIAQATTTAAASRAGWANSIARAVVIGALALVILVIALSIAVSRSIAGSLRKLIRSANAVVDVTSAELVRVADSDDMAIATAAPDLPAVTVPSADEIGELATTMNRLQATAVKLVERQTTTRHNVSVMFANVARRTQNLVGRQRVLLEDLAGHTGDPEFSGRLHRLGRVSARLRRTADSLLVASGIVEADVAGTPMWLGEVIAAAVSDLDGTPTVQVHELPGVAVTSAVVADLRLLLTELLDNAMNFSPPGTPVQVYAEVTTDCRIAIIDHGIGMTPARLAEENHRLIERERLDLAPTNLLGLFVVGRLARRHGLTVQLDHTVYPGPPGRTGVTATVVLPVRLLTRRAPTPVGGQASPAVSDGTPSAGFSWFTPFQRRPTPVSAPPAIARSAAAGGAPSAGQELRDPTAERLAINELMSGLARGEAGTE